MLCTGTALTDAHNVKPCNSTSITSIHHVALAAALELCLTGAGLGRKLDYLSLESPLLQARPSKRSSGRVPPAQGNCQDVTMHTRHQHFADPRHIASIDMELSTCALLKPHLGTLRVLRCDLMESARLRSTREIRIQGMCHTCSIECSSDDQQQACSPCTACYSC